MAITIEEMFDSRETIEGDNPAITLKFIIKGTDNDIEAKTSLFSTTPGIYDGLVRQNWSVEYHGPLMWLGTVRYGPLQRQPETGQSVFQFDTGGGTQHITQSLCTMGAYAPPGRTAPYFGGAIGVTRDNVEGVDITVPVFNFSETHYIPAAWITPAYQSVLFNLTGKVNNSGFRWFAAGECLFLGASGAQRGQEDWEITYRFAASPNRTGIIIGDITGIAKKGWEYLWVRYEDAEDTGANALVKRPMAVYVEQVYDWADFSLLGI